MKRKDAILTAPLLAGTEIGDRLNEQIGLETDAVAAGVRRYHRLAQEAVERGDGAALKPAQRLVLYWFKDLAAAIKEDQKDTPSETPGIGVYGPPIRIIDADRMAVVALHTALSACMAEPGGIIVSRIAYNIGRDVLAEAGVDQLRKTQREHNAAYRDRIEAEGEAADKKRRPSESKVFDELTKQIRRLSTTRINWWANKTLADPVWERTASAHLGMRLLWHIIGNCVLPVKEGTPIVGFHHERRQMGIRSKAFIRLDDAAAKIIEEGHEVRAAMRPRYLPMIVEPFPWQKAPEDDQLADIGAVGGGYVHTRTPFISKPTNAQKAAIRAGEMTRVYQCLNILNSTAWGVNSRVLDVVNDVWNRGGGELGIPRREDWPMPPVVTNDDKELIERMKAERRRLYRENLRLRADRETFLGKLSDAELFAGKEAIWFPHQLDFRGRCYPIPPRLNHQGDDVCRGLLEFSEAKSPGETGDRELLIHAANCYGVDKVPFHEREDWACANLREIARSSRDPMNEDFWRKAENPWQFLAACIAIFNPERGARLPIQKDGTANGLQWYAALARDETTAAMVNLTPGDRPANLYGAVADALRPSVEADAAAGDPVAQAVLPFVLRDVVKQPVMTHNYGVTMVGARKQIMGKLAEKGLEREPLYRASDYLSKKVLAAVSAVCPAAGEIMDWLRDCARSVISVNRKASIQWTSPLGMPVVQPYKNMRRARINTVLQTLVIQVEDDTFPVRAKRQIDGFPPNYIHSLDGTHMLRTAEACHHAKVTFAAVHDSFWTHAATAGAMGRIAREQFLAIHETPLLEVLRSELEKRYERHLPEPPPRGTLDLSLCLDSPYMFH